jgi:TRAP-type mannitol/chloroaromatic compound transport system permease large subunit
MLVVMVVMFLLGFILDFIEITFVVVPIVAPILLTMGLDPVWLGVMIAINLQTSFLTPPFGFALFYLRGVAPAEVSTADIYKGVAPFIVIQLNTSSRQRHKAASYKCKISRINRDIFTNILMAYLVWHSA